MTAWTHGPDGEVDEIMGVRHREFAVEHLGWPPDLPFVTEYLYPQRRFLLGCLENCGTNMIEDMLRWKTRWIRLGERLHPGDAEKSFPVLPPGIPPDVLRHGAAHGWAAGVCAA